MPTEAIFSEGADHENLRSGQLAVIPVRSRDTTAADAAPLPRTPRRPRKPKGDRGLPEDTELQSLAMAYLECQAAHFPQLNSVWNAAKDNPATLLKMVDDFKFRHRGGAVDVVRVQQQQLKAVGLTKAGGVLVHRELEFRPVGVSEWKKASCQSESGILPDRFFALVLMGQVSVKGSHPRVSQR
jgi:hypothetical protein